MSQSYTHTLNVPKGEVQKQKYIYPHFVDMRRRRRRGGEFVDVDKGCDYFLVFKYYFKCQIVDTGTIWSRGRQTMWIIIFFGFFNAYLIVFGLFLPNADFFK